MVLSGNLKDFGLTELVQMMGQGHKSGLLQLEFGGRECLLYFVAGHLVHAEFESLTGEEAFFKVFCLPDGRFSFLAEPRPLLRTIFTDLTALLIEAARLTDEECRESPASQELFTPEELSEEFWEPSPDGLESWELPSPDERQEPEQQVAQAEASLSPHPRLVEAAWVLAERLRNSPATADFGIFSRNTLLKSSNAEEYGLPAALRLDGRASEEPLDREATAAALAAFTDAAEEAGESLGVGGLRFALLLTGLGERSLLMGLGGLTAAVSLRPGVRAADFHAEVTQIAAPARLLATATKSTMG